MTFRGALKMGGQNANKSDHIAVAISLANPLAGTLEKTAPLRSQICVRARSVTTMLEDMNIQQAQLLETDSREGVRGGGVK